MGSQHSFDPERRAGTWFATAMVFFLGSIGASIIAAAGGGDPMVVMIIFGCVLALTLVFLWAAPKVATPSVTSLYAWAMSRKPQPEEDYTVRPRKSERVYGTHAPPTAEDVKEAKEQSLRTWVPANRDQS